VTDMRLPEVSPDLVKKFTKSSGRVYDVQHVARRLGYEDIWASQISTLQGSSRP
jgi:hypothetical protein